MDFGSFREMSVKIGKDRKLKKFRMNSGKRRVHSVSGRHYDDSWLNAPGIFLKASEAFYNFQSLPSSHEIHADIAQSFLKYIIPLLP